MNKRRKGTHFALDPLLERVKRIGLTHYIIHSSLIAHVSLLKKTIMIRQPSLGKFNDDSLQ